MKAAELIDFLEQELNTGFFTGVPDSLLASFVNQVMEQYGSSPDKHLIAANEGNAAALAAGYYLATGRPACVYMQNSGQGNMVNPYASLLSPQVYQIPCVFVIGWRGQPGVKDEPQHVFQGQITKELMELLTVEYVVITEEDTLETVAAKSVRFKQSLDQGKCVAFVVEKNALKSDQKPNYQNEYQLKREDAIREIVNASGQDLIVCTTGKASRELYEIRERGGMGHGMDFLTVGSMGHCSSIAMELAVNRKDKTVWCIDGDGAILMHMGAMAVIGACSPPNLIHVLMNNEAHETVGGMPTAAGQVDLMKIAEGCGYGRRFQAETAAQVRDAARQAREGKGLAFIEIKTALGARADLGRPATSAVENKEAFMGFLKENER